MPSTSVLQSQSKSYQSSAPALAFEFHPWGCFKPRVQWIITKATGEQKVSKGWQNVNNWWSPASIMAATTRRWLEVQSAQKLLFFHPDFWWASTASGFIAAAETFFIRSWSILKPAAHIAQNKVGVDPILWKRRKRGKAGDGENGPKSWGKFPVYTEAVTTSSIQ